MITTMQNGKFYGYENQEATKTLLCMMLRGVASNYADVVAMIPLTAINSSIIKEWWYRLIAATCPIGFDIVATIVDGYSANRKFYELELCNGNLTPWIEHPFKEGDQMFLLFDSVHVFKNVYNNLLTKKEFRCPSFNGQELSANLQHILDLYKAEFGNPIKYAFKLNDKVLNPKSIEKTNVDLAHRFFHESTVHALEYFANNLGKMNGNQQPISSD